MSLADRDPGMVTRQEGDPLDLPWYRPLRDRRCRAVREPRRGHPHGRCELKAGHDGLHALERGFDTPRWSTAWQSERRLHAVAGQRSEP